MTPIKLRVSVEMPMYSGQRLIRRGLDSVLRQTYENLEVIISITLRPITPGRSA